MPEEKLMLMGVCRTLLSIPKQDSDVRLTCHGFKSGPMVVSLDARMRSVQIDRGGPQWIVSWKISNKLVKNTTLPKDAICLMSIILSPNDQKIAKLKYKAGDKFLLRPKSLEKEGEDSYCNEMKGLLNGQDTIIEIESYEVNGIGEVGYRLKFLQPEQTWRWFLTEEVIDEDFNYLGKSYEKARFLMIE